MCCCPVNKKFEDTNKIMSYITRSSYRNYSAYFKRQIYIMYAKSVQRGNIADTFLITGRKYNN